MTDSSPSADSVSLFQLGDFRLASGAASNFKIECDALTNQDWETLAMLLAERLPRFGSVEGVPRGGIKLAAFLSSFSTEGPLLIVDDVWTTGGSWERYRSERDAIGAVVFARNHPLPEVTALFQMTPVSAYMGGPEMLGQCDNCDLPITEADDYLFDAFGMLHEACNPIGSSETV